MEAPVTDPPDIMTENIRKYMKAHFETPGAPQVESLNNLAARLNRKGAAQLFYQTCVLTSQGFLKVKQREPFGDILISKGPKM
ncbi:Rad21/Rec8-like family protein, putative [Theobroma cacao]|uniref:Rad21/Rec8-like family protein, putative n=1 Tax=Theobroma cacao TaxID=3641 RepID=A0A061FM25_THECC|nr:Rad21/Rec8-like family protein, putative [Theobroma cacao]